MFKVITTYITCVALLLFFFGYVATPILQYAEGWNTFYYDSDYLVIMLSSIGTAGCIKAFLLQFFAHPWNGTAVMTLLMIVFMSAINFILSRFKNNFAACVVSAVICLISAISLTSWMGNISPLSLLNIGNEKNQTKEYMILSNHARHKQWDDIIARCNENSPVTNLLHQNCLNMALAEKGILGDKLLDQPVRDITSIYVNQIQTAEIAGLLSDIYFSFGHIAQSQRYAFETNEKKNNLSPRMLQRLIETNLIFGQKEVADKTYQLIMCNLERHLTIVEMARNLHVSPTQVKVCFRKVYGVPVFTFARKRRMEMAAKLLAETDESILEIAGRIGYENGSKFARAFRDVMGISPGRYRRIMLMQKEESEAV